MCECVFSNFVSAFGNLCSPHLYKSDKLTKNMIDGRSNMSFEYICDYRIHSLKKCLQRNEFWAINSCYMYICNLSMLLIISYLLLDIRGTKWLVYLYPNFLCCNRIWNLTKEWGNSFGRHKEHENTNYLFVDIIWYNPKENNAKHLYGFFFLFLLVSFRKITVVAQLCKLLIYV